MYFHVYWVPFANEAVHKSLFLTYGPGKSKTNYGSAKRPAHIPVSRRGLQNTSVPWSNRHFNGNWSVLLPYKSVMPPGPEVFDHLRPQWGLLCATGSALTRGCSALTRASSHSGATVAAIDIFHFLWPPHTLNQITKQIMCFNVATTARQGTKLLLIFQRRVWVGSVCKGPPPKVGVVGTEPWWAVRMLLVKGVEELNAYVL